jgi:hypothetical protein
MKHLKKTAAAGLAVTVGAIGGASALATPGSGVTPTDLARGTLEDQHHHGRHQRHVKLTLHRPSDVAVQQVTVDPGGTSGWHSHPGPAVVVVKAGSFTLYDGDDRRCRGKTYSADPANPAGSVFVDPGRGHVHIGRNEGTVATQLYVTYLDLPVGAAPRIDVPSPGNCPF